MGRHITAALGAALLVFGASTAALAADSDGDGLDDSFEIVIGTNPALADSDGDGWNDRVEFFEKGSSPNAADTDLDTLLDPADPSPLDAGTGPLDGVTIPLQTGFPITEQYARSGQSAFAGRGVLIHSGALVRRYSFAQSRGIRPAILMPECCDGPPMVMNQMTSEFAITLTYNSQSQFDGTTGHGMDFKTGTDTSNPWAEPGEPDEAHANVYYRTYQVLTSMIMSIEADGVTPECPCGCGTPWTGWQGDLTRARRHQLDGSRKRR